MVRRFTALDCFNFLKSFLPPGDLLLGLNFTNNNLRRLIEALSKEYCRIGNDIADFIEDFIPDMTQNFLQEWERSLKIPDDCIPLADTDDERRDNILLKLRSLTIQTVDDLIDLGAKLGIVITIIPVDDAEVTFEYLFPIYFYPIPAHRFFIEVSGDFASDPIKGATLQCLIKKLVQAYTKVVFIQVP